MNNWYVITGGPSCGKTTILKELQKKGYTTIPEAARVYIDREMNKGRTIEEIRSDELFFQKELLDMKIETEKRLNTNEIIFFDRGIPDTTAYLQIRNFAIGDCIQESINNSSYKKVFLFELLKYEKDYARVESEEQAHEIERLLEETYKSLNIAVIKVPFMSINKRVKFILNSL